MKFWKRLFSLLVLAAMLAALAMPALAMPALAAASGAVSTAAGAAVSSFSDITDPAVGEAVELLHTMGIINGIAPGRFMPDAELTRAQFCKLAITIMGREDDVADYSSRTIFPDVTSSHWARGYVNLAANITVGGENGGRLITGKGDGTFAPDAAISYSEAVTLLLRVLGYTKEANSNWPRGAMTTADKIGLTQNMPNLDARAVISRGAGAILFRNLLSCKDASGKAFYATLGETKERVILFGSDGNGGVNTSAGNFLLPTPLPASMDMRQGVLVTKNDKVVAFLPTASGVEITLSSKATENYLKTASATYSVSDTAKVYVPDEDGPAGSMKPTGYTDLYDKLAAGVRLTAYFTGSRISELCLRYAGSSLTPQGDAVIVTGAATEATFYQLTGGATNMRILKDGSPIRMGDIKPNDVATYNALTNTLTISDLRIPTVYDAAIPNVRSPEKIKIAGLDTELKILPCAADSLSKYRLGDSFTVLLTADGSVAGVVDTASRTSSTAVGIWDGSSVSVPLADGKELTFKASSTTPEGQLVTVSAYSRSSATVSRVTNRTIPGSFDVKNMTLGEYTVAADVHVYERFGTSGPATEVNLSALTQEVIPAAKITAYHLNTSDMVDALVLDNVTGDLYAYGILRAGQKSAGSMDGITAYNRTAIVENSANPSPDLEGGPITGLSFTNGAFGGMIESGDRVASLIELTAVRGVSADDFFTMNDVQYVSAGGRVYRVAEKVECYDRTTKKWFAENPLETVKSYGSTLTVYVDPISSAVRVVVAN